MAQITNGHVAVIGAGFAGLAAALELQERGYSVTLYERTHHVGGYASNFSRRGYTFDASIQRLVGNGREGGFVRSLRRWGVERPRYAEWH